MKTNDLEQVLGLSKHTIRYYEKEGFIEPKRDENGYRDYSEEDIQILQLVKFLRNLNISIDDVKAILKGELDFQECLRVNQIHLDKQIEGMKETKQVIDQYCDKKLPLILELSNIEIKPTNGKLGFQKTTPTVSLGRKLTKALAIRQLLFGLLSAAFISWGLSMWFFTDTTLPIYIIICIYLILTIVVEMIFIAFSFRESSIVMLDNTLNQSIEFLDEGIRYYRFDNYIKSFQYFIAVLLGKDDKLMHNYRYDEITEVKVIAKKRYMNLGSPIAYEVYIPDFYFQFSDGESFYFYWPMTLDDDARYIAYILEDKVKNIKDHQNILYAMKNGISLNDYIVQE